MRLIVNQENIRARDKQIATYDCVSFLFFQKSSSVTAQKFILKNHSNSKLFLKSNCLNFVELNPLLPLIHLRLNHLMHTIQRISFPLFLNLSLALPLAPNCVLSRTKTQQHLAACMLPLAKHPRTCKHASLSVPLAHAAACTRTLSAAMPAPFPCWPHLLVATRDHTRHSPLRRPAAPITPRPRPSHHLRPATGAQLRQASPRARGATAPSKTSSASPAFARPRRQRRQAHCAARLAAHGRLHPHP